MRGDVVPRDTMNEGSAKRVNESAAERAWGLLALAYAAGLGTMMLYANRAFYHDDAYITLRYAKNVIDGAGAVWNPDEYVQGYTNFLHLMLVSGLGRLGIDLIVASRVVGVAALLSLLVVLVVWTRRGEDANASRLWHLPAIVVMSSAPMLVWSLGGLEGTLFSALVASGCLLFLLGLEAEVGAPVFIASGACLGMSFLTRPDGVVFVALSAGWLLVDRRSPQRRRDLIGFLAGAALIMAPYVVWQSAYYGDLVPNTFYAKTGAPLPHRLRSGWGYLVDYALAPPFLPLLLLGTLVYATAAKRWDEPLGYLSLLIAAYAGFVVFVGGDHMQAFRLFLPLVALMGLALARTWSKLIVERGHLTVALVSAALLLLSTLQLSDQQINPREEDPAAFVGSIVGKHIAQAWPEGSLVALNTAGSTPYYAHGHRYVDMLGLNDAHIAKREIDGVELRWQLVPGHLKGDGSYVLDRRPDFIIVGPAEGTLVSKPWFLSDLELSRDPRFADEYEIARVALDGSGRVVEEDGLIFTYYRRMQD